MRDCRGMVCFAAGFVALFLLVPGAARAQTADIVGTVTDQTGAVVEGVTVTVENLATRVTRSALSDSAGNFLVPLLAVGRYAVRAQKAGFRAWSVPEVALAVGDRLRLDVQLEVGAVEQTIEVTAVTPALQSEVSHLGTLVNDRFVRDLPLNGRNFVRLAQLAAGAHESVPNALSSGNRPDDRRRTSAVAVNGQRDFVNNFLVDGMDNNERSIGTVIVKPAMDALAEFKVQTNMYSAEFGRTAGGVINLVTKSGTNDWHGSLYEFLRNDKLDAKNFFNPPGAPIPKFRQNQFGGSVGGPMREGDFAGINPIFNPLGQRPDPNRPDSFIRDRFPNDRIPASLQDPVAVRLLTLYPIPQIPGLANNFTHVPVKTQRDDTFDVRVDFNFSERDVSFARYSFNDTTTDLPPHLPKVGDIEAGGDRFQFAGPAFQRSQGLVLNHVHTFRPNLLGEFKAGYARFALLTVPPNFGKNVSEQFGIRNANFDLNSSGLTPMNIVGFRGIGDSNFVPIVIFNNVFQYVGALTWTRSGHNVKTGADYRRRQFTVHQNPEGRGPFHFNTNFTIDPTGAVARSGNSMASFLLGLPFITERRNHLVWPGMRTTDFAAYVQDDWRITPWLTLNLGLRYEFFTPFTEVADRIANPDLTAGRILIAGRDGVSRTAGVKADWNDVAPRFGFAARLPRGYVLRGGYGLNFYAANYGSGTHMRTPPFVSVFRIDTPTLEPINRLRDGLPLPAPSDPRDPAGSLTAVAFNLRSSYVQQYNLTLQKEIYSGLVGSVAYVGALGRKQLSNYDANLALPGPGPILQRRLLNRLFPRVAAITLADTFGVSNYHALQSTVEHLFKSGLNFLGNYTYARLIDDNPAVAGGKPGSGPYPQVVTNRRLEKGNSDIDVRHRFVMMANYELPFGAHRTGLAGVLAKGWQVNGILVLQSGLTFTVANASARANTGGGDRPNRVASGKLPAEQRSVARFFDTSAFVPQPLFTVGDTGRNTLYGPGQKNLDFSVGKDFYLTEQWRLQFKADFFNLTNTPNFGVPQNALGASDFGTINNTANAAPRQIQFALRLLF
jgi:outer membrane receptor protein involved in Fe transport